MAWSVNLSLPNVASLVVTVLANFECPLDYWCIFFICVACVSKAFWVFACVPVDTKVGLFATGSGATVVSNAEVHSVTWLVEPALVLCELCWVAFNTCIVSGNTSNLAPVEISVITPPVSELFFVRDVVRANHFIETRNVLLRGLGALWEVFAHEGQVSHFVVPASRVVVVVTVPLSVFVESPVVWDSSEVNGG